MIHYAVGAAFLAGMLAQSGTRWLMAQLRWHKPKCAWCDGPRSHPRRPVCDECVGHDREAMPGWQ